MKILLGRFYFKLTDSKNLIGEFSNNQCHKTYTEGAIRIPPYAGYGRFIGTYRSTWCENGGEIAFLAELRISPMEGHEDARHLRWHLVENRVVKPKPHFEGEGMLCDGMLIGNYWECGQIE